MVTQPNERGCFIHSYLKHVVIDQALGRDGYVNFSDFARDDVTFHFPAHQLSEKRVKLFVSVPVACGA